MINENMHFNVELPKIRDRKYDIEDFGELNFDPYHNQQIIQKAIDYVSESGGGKLRLCSMFILCGPIVLKSGVELNLPNQCYLKFVKEKRFYQVGVRNWEGQECFRCNSPISAYKASNIAITGSGVIDGDGDNWRPLKEIKVTPMNFMRKLEKSPYYINTEEGRIWYPSKSAYEGCLLTEERMTLETAQDYYDFFRPVLISLVECDHILLDGFLSFNSPAWNIHPLFCDHLTVSNMMIKNIYAAQNGDGIDVESCTNVVIKYTTFNVGDDGICIKSGKNRKAREIKRPTVNVHIHHCTVFHAHGGIVIGSEMSRGVRNVLCEKCSFIGTDTGIRFKSAIGRGGVVENIVIKNINMNDILEQAVIMNMDYTLYKMAHERKDFVISSEPDDIPYFKDILLDRIRVGSAREAIKIVGINEDTIKDITIRDSWINATHDISLKKCSNIRAINTTFNINGDETHYEDGLLPVKE